MKHQKTRTILGTLIIIFVLSTSVIAYSLLQSIITVQAQGTVSAVNIAVYKDVNCTQVLTNFTNIEVSQNSTNNIAIVYLRNEGNRPVTLSMVTSNWSPLNSGLSFSWDKEAFRLERGTVTSAKLTLTVPVTNITAFSFTITFTGTQITGA